MKEVVIIDDLNYKDILKSINLSAKKNEILTISGSNKCGKTTLLKILYGLIKTNNSILINDKYIEEYNVKVLSDLIGYVTYRNNYIFKYDTVEDELTYLLDFTDLDTKSKNKRYKEIIKLFKLTKYEKLNPKELYRNLQLKLELAKEIILPKEILLLDDICLNMTKEETKEILNILKELKKETTIIMSTMNLEEALESDYIYILSDGKIVLEGTKEEVLVKDNVLNKLGLELPFMIDLSVKLKDYDLIDNIELDMDRMVDILWK